MKQYSIENIEIQFMLVLKLQQLQREGLPSLTYRSLEDYVQRHIFRVQQVTSLHQAAKLVMKIACKDIVIAMSQQAIIDGKKQKLEDFMDMIGGTTHGQKES